MSSSSSSRSGDTPQSGDHQSGEKKSVGAPHKLCNLLKGGCGRMPTEDTAKECARCRKTLSNRKSKQKERSNQGVASTKKRDGVQLVNQARQLAANAMSQLAGCDHCSPVLQQLEAELAGLLGDLVEPDLLTDNVSIEDTAGGSVSSSASAEAAPYGPQIVTATEVYAPPQQFYSAASTTVEGQFSANAPPTVTRIHHYTSRASADDAALIIAAQSQESDVIANYVPPLATQLLAVDTTLPIDVTNAFEQRALFPLNFFEGNQLRINEVFQKAAEALHEFEREGKFFPFLTPANFRFIGLPSNRHNEVVKGRYTGFAVLVQMVDIGTSLEYAVRCPYTRRLLAPEIQAGHPWTTASGSWSLYRMYYDALKSKMQLRRTTADNTFHFVEKAVMKKGPKVREDGWWELNQHIMAALSGGLFPDQQGRRLGIEAFVRLFQRTTDKRYLDSRICVDAFESQQFSEETHWFREQ